MDDQPTDANPKSGFFKSATGLVAGLTTLVAAVAGLLAAFDKLPFQRSSPSAKLAASESAAPTNANSAAATNEDVPTVYDGKKVDGTLVHLEWTDNQWVLNENGTTYNYEEVVSPDETKTLARSNDYQTYLRWPIEGGTAEEGNADKTSWTTYAELNPPASAH